MISPEKLQILTHLQKLPKNVGDLDKLIVAKALKSGPKSNKSPNLITLIILHNILKCGLIPASFCLASSFLTTQVESEKIVGIKSCPIFVVYKLTEGSHCSLHLIFPNSPISHYLIGPLSKIAHVIECYKSWNQF